MHTYPVAFAGFADKYEHGERLVVSAIRQIPNSCWPASLKCRSRMHYYLADREARAVDHEARALLLDQSGYISEASTANFIAYRRSIGFLSPRREKILPGVSVNTLEELAGQFGETFSFQDLTVDDVLQADEAFLCSTSPCLLPVIAINGQAIGIGKPGPMFRQAIDAWNQLVGVNIVEQARQFARRMS
jgi:branched-subunit amino acid aminotransferase/4-amino-4-deoxychorismate lyase